MLANIPRNPDVIEGDSI